MRSTRSGKKNTPSCMTWLMTHALEWPSLTAQWLPDADQAWLGLQRAQADPGTLPVTKNHLLLHQSSFLHEDAQFDSLIMIIKRESLEDLVQFLAN